MDRLNPGMPKFPSPILLFLVAAAWLIPLFGKKLEPGVFGSAGVQWGGALLLAVLVPFAALAALPRSSAGDRLRMSWGQLIFALMPLVLNLVFQAVMIPMLSRVTAKQADDEAKKTGTVSKFKEAALNGSSGETRKRTASLAYQIFGISTEWRKDDGSMETYTPSEKDLMERKKYRQFDETGLGARREMAWQLKQIRGLFILFLVSLGITMVALVWRRKSLSAVGLSSSPVP